MIWQSIARICLRWIAFPFAIWLGLPEETAAELVKDPDVVAVVAGIVAVLMALIEGWYAWATWKGGAT